MTDQAVGLDTRGFATTPTRYGPMVGMRARSRARDFQQSPITLALSVIRRAVAARANACFCRFLAGLDETRRWQAAIERARYRHLIYDSDTGISFAADATRPCKGPRTHGRTSALSA